MTGKWIWFDLDGTIVDFYGVENWLFMLENSDATPYRIAKPLHNMNRLARALNRAQANGYKIGIISWLSKNSTAAYDEEVTRAKMQWLDKHLHSVSWDKIQIVSYGMNKWELCRAGILFDDEARNRKAWQGMSYEPRAIFTVLNNINK